MVEAVAQFDYPANDSDELTLRTGDVIRNVVQQEGGWWSGELNGRRGVFPDNFVKVIPATTKEELDNLSNDVHLRKGNVRRCKAIFSYKPVNDDELELQIDDVIDVIDEVEDGWWKGVLKGNTGVFPSNFVQELEVPPPAVAADVTNHKDQDVTQDQAVIDAKPKPAKGIAAIFQGGAPKLKHSPSDGQENKNKVPLRPVTFPVQNSHEAPVLPPKQVKDIAKVLFNYEAQNEDELTITEGEIITVLSKDVEDKGWWKGELNGRTGVFPDNFVEIIVQAEPLRPKKPDRVDKLQGGFLPSKPPAPLGLNLASTVTDPVPPNKSDGDIPSPQNRNLPPLAGAVKLPDFPKKEDKPDRPAPPLPIKKPLIPPPMKKTNRLSTGATVFDGMTDEMKAKNNQEPHVNPARVGDDLDLDSVETTTEKLDHKTAQRPKFPNRRPPSHIYVKENHDTTPEKENGDISKENQAPWMLELMRNQAMKRVTHGTPDPKPNKDAIKDTDERPVLKPVTSRSSADVTDSKPLPTKPVIPKPPLPSVSKPAINVKATVLDLKRSRSSPNVPDPVSPPVHLDTESTLTDVIRAVQMWKDYCAARTSLEETRREVRELHEAFDVLKAQFSKQLADVVSELESEKRARILVQTELDSLKKTMMAHK